MRKWPFAVWLRGTCRGPRRACKLLAITASNMLIPVKRGDAHGNDAIH